MNSLAAIRAKLAAFGIRDSSDYAEILIAEALNGERKGAVNRGFDVQVPAFGRIEVKCRTLPADGRMEERVELGAAKEDGFDYLCIVIFNRDYSVKGAVLVPYSVAWNYLSKSNYSRISFQIASGLEGAFDITKQVRDASLR